jgi:glycosyltransferase involved in cell wall biosynthesis
MSGTVCLVSPGHLASNPRLIKEADALRGAGYGVTVVAAGLTSFIRPFDEEIVSTAPWTALRAPQPTARARLATRAARAVTGLLFPSSARIPPWLASLAHGAQTTSLTTAACAVEADLYIAHYVAALPAAAAAARRHGAALGYDAEDFHAGEHGAHANALARSIEGRHLPDCTHLTAASPLIADAYADLYGVRPVPVLNVFPLAMAGDGSSSPRRSRASGTLSAYWFSQTVGLDRGLQAFIEAMARAKAKVTLHVRGSDQWGNWSTLADLARARGLADRVELLPLASPSKMVEEAHAYDIGLSLETDVSESRRRCLTNKIFTYLLAGRPVLMSDTPAQRALAADLGAAAAVVPLDGPDAIAARLDRWALTPGALDEASREAWRLAQTRYNWDIEKATFLASVERALAGRVLER